MIFFDVLVLGFSSFGIGLVCGSLLGYVNGTRETEKRWSDAVERAAHARTR